jgi:phospholipid/cholesterol/gamma-HCH transport system permease protein
MAVTRRLAARAVPLRRIGLAVWVLATAIAGLPDLVSTHRLARRRVVEALFDTALRPLPILTALAALAGAVAAFSASLVLDVAAVAPSVLAVLRHVLTRDIVPLLVGIFVAGRSGIGLTVRLRHMADSGEADALRLQSEDPARYLLSPALLGFLAAAATLFLWGLFIAHFSAALVLDRLHAVAIGRYRELVGAALHGDIPYGLARTVCFSLLAFLAAGFEGCGGGRRSDGAGEAAGRTFVVSLLAILAAEALFSGLGL